MELPRLKGSALPGRLAETVNGLLEDGEVIHAETVAFFTSEAVILTNLRLLEIHASRAFYSPPAEARWSEVKWVTRFNSVFSLEFTSGRDKLRFTHSQGNIRHFAAVISQLAPYFDKSRPGIPPVWLGDGPDVVDIEQETVDDKEARRPTGRPAARRNATQSPIRSSWRPFWRRPKYLFLLLLAAYGIYVLIIWWTDVRVDGVSTYNAQYVSADSVPFEWPFLVDNGQLVCDDGPAVLFRTLNGAEYALNGVAQNWADQRGYRDVVPLLKRDPIFPDRFISVGPPIALGLELCD